MASSVSSLGPPMTGPGNSAPSVGFAVCATTRRGMCSNKEPRSGNTLCHKNNVERSYAIHESRLASVKASLSVSTPLRLDFVDKRLSKNFHLRRHHERVVCDNLKLLRALEEIQSRTSSITAACVGGPGDALGQGGAPSSGGKLAAGGGSSSTIPAVGVKKSLAVSATSAGKSHSSSMLNTMLERKRNAKAARVARENQQILERIARSKSLYSRDKMRQHRQRHQRFLRLRKTDYTAGHLLAATTAMRRWTGGTSRDEGFAYSFEEGSRHHHRHHRHHRSGKRGNRARGGGGGGRSRVSNSASLPAASHAGVATAAARGPSHSPTPVQNKRFLRGNSSAGRRSGTQSAPRLPSLLLDADGIYSGGNVLSCPDLEQSLLAAGIPARFGGEGHGDSRERVRPSSDSGVGGGGSSKRGLRRERNSRQRGTKDAAGGGGSGGADGARGASAGTDSLFDSHRGGSVSAGQDGLFLHGSRGGGGGRGDRFLKGEDRERGMDRYLPAVKENMAGAELDRIFNPLAFPDEKKGVRVLIQATKPLEVLNHVGQTWTCFIRIMTKDPFDDQLDIRIIHDRAEVCRKVLSLEEATAICEGADKAAENWGRRSPSSCSSFPKQTLSTMSPSGEAGGGKGGGGGGGGLGAGKTAAAAAAGGGVRGSGLKRCSISDDGFSDFLTGLFTEVDTDGKGSLTPERITSIMHHAELGLTEPELQLVIAEADENADGNIDYYEFIPMAFNLVNAFRARRRACEEMLDESLDLDQQALYALYDADFDRMVRQLKDLCKSFDPNGKGVIPRADFKQCISADRCGGLTKIESKLLLNLLPKDPQGNVFYRKLGAGLEQVRFTTLRNTAAEAAATDTQKYLMDLCREEDAIATGGKQYSGVLRARQLTKLLLNAPLLSLSRLHVTAVMSQAHIVDGMVNYVELAPMMAKTIEGIFHPRSLKMRHDMFKTPGVGVGGGGGGATAAGGINNKGAGGAGGGGGPDFLQLQGLAAATVRGKTREEVQKIFVDVLRKEKQGTSIERLKDPETFAKCLRALGLDLEPDTINALWVAADVDNREGATFVDVVDFCFSYILFVEREKQVKNLQRTLTSADHDPQNGLPGGRVEAAAAAVAAATTLAMGDAPVAKQDPLLALARALVRHVKVTSLSEGQVGLEFLDDSQILHDISSKPGGMAATVHGATAARNQHDGSGGSGVCSREYHHRSAPELASSSSDECESGSGGDGDDGDDPGVTGGNCNGASEENVCIESGDDGGGGEGGGGGSEGAGATNAVVVVATDRRQRPSAAARDVTVLLRTRRNVPVVGPSGQPITTLKPLSKGTLKTDEGGVPKAPIEGSLSEARCRGKGKESDAVSGMTSPVDSSIMPRIEAGGSRSSSSLEVEAPRGEAQDMVIKVYWEGAARDRAYVEAYPAKVGGKRRKGSKGNSSTYSCHHNRHLRLSVRVPTLAVVDALAATKFAERVAQQIAIQVEGDAVVEEVAGDRQKYQRQQEQQEQQHKPAARLRLVGVDAKAVFIMN